MAEQMHSDPGTKPNPDPTIATNEAVERAMKSERDYVDGKIETLEERLHGMDRATELRLSTLPTLTAEIDTKISHQRELMDEKFSSVATQFKERDTRSEREARDNKLAVDAAFAAQEKQAVAQNESNALAINKSEAATAETIKTNQELTTAKTDSLSKGLDELKLQVAGFISVRQGAQENRVDQRAGSSLSVQVLSAAIAFGALVILAASYIATH